MRDGGDTSNQSAGPRKFARAVSLPLILLFMGLCLVLTFAQRRPRQATTSSPRRVSVRAGGNLQKAIDAARPGDTIELEAGATFQGPFTLPDKGPSTDYITIRTSTPDSALVAPNERITPAHSALLPRLVSPGGGQPALQTAAGAHHYRLIGLEIRSASADALVYDLVKLGDGSEAQNTMEKVPHHLHLDRCLITAFSSQTLKRGIALHSADTTIENCYISGFKSAEQDAQAIAGWNGPGPFRIINNYLEASGENLMFGGATPWIAGLVPSDIEVRHNHFYKPLSWRAGEAGYAGIRWSVKNQFELKSARRVVFEGNVLENSWGEVQSGYGTINLTVRGDSGPQATIEDVMIRNNVIRHAPNGINILGKDPNQPSGHGRGIRIVNNLFEDIDGKRWGGDGEFLKISDMPNVAVDHNTVLQTGNIILAYGIASSGFAFTNNLVRHNNYGIIGPGHASGTHTLKDFFPGAIVRRNLMVGADFSIYPGDNFYPTKLEKVGMVNHAGANYRLRPDSQYKGKATDGADVGCDLDALEAATAGVARR